MPIDLEVDLTGLDDQSTNKDLARKIDKRTKKRLKVKEYPDYILRKRTKEKEKRFYIRRDKERLFIDNRGRQFRKTWSEMGVVSIEDLPPDRGPEKPC